MMRSCWLVLVLGLAVAGPGRAQNARPPEPPDENAAKPAEKPSAVQAAELFDRLKQTQDGDEAAGIVAAISRLWLRSGSDTADLLMTRALQAMQTNDYPLALQLLDAIVDLRPEWAEGWNKRATVRYFAGDSKGSMADIAETLKREPRHLGALAGMGAILEESGLPDEALRAYQRGLGIAPSFRPMLDAAKRLKAAGAGQTL